MQSFSTQAGSLPTDKTSSLQNKTKQHSQDEDTSTQNFSHSQFDEAGTTKPNILSDQSQLQSQSQTLVASLTDTTAVRSTNSNSSRSKRQGANLHKIFAFLSLIELSRCCRCSKRWQSQAILACKKMKFLDLSQFWTIIGNVNRQSDLDSLLKMCTRFESVEQLSLAYCSKMSESDFAKIIRSFSSTCLSKLTHLSLFNCTRLTDKVVLLIIRSMPCLQRLDLGHNHQLTNQSVSLLSNLTELRTLSLKNNLRFTDDILSSFEADFPRLIYLDIQNTNLDPALVQELRDSRPEIKILGPKNQNFLYRLIGSDSADVVV